MDKTQPEFWRSIRPGTIVVLKDERTLAKMLSEKKGTSGESFEVPRVTVVREAHGLCEWRLIDLDANRRLVAKIVDKEIKLSSMSFASDWEPKRRSDLVAQQAFFLFDEPANPDNFKPSDLAFTATMPREDTHGKKFEYRKRAQGDLHGEVTQVPAASGVNRLYATIAEYSAFPQEVEEPEFMIVEFGATSDGSINFLVGSEVRMSDVDVLFKK